MKDSILNRLQHISARFDEITLLLAQPEVMSDQNRFRTLSQEYAQLEPVVKTFSRWQENAAAKAEAREMLTESEQEMRELAAEGIIAGDPGAARVEPQHLGQHRQRSLRPHRASGAKKQ